MPDVVLRQQQHLLGLITRWAYHLGHSFIQILDFACKAGTASCQGAYSSHYFLSNTVITLHNLSRIYD